MNMCVPWAALLDPELIHRESQGDQRFSQTFRRLGSSSDVMISVRRAKVAKDTHGTN